MKKEIFISIIIFSLIVIIGIGVKLSWPKKIEVRSFEISKNSKIALSAQHGHIMLMNPYTNYDFIQIGNKFYSKEKEESIMNSKVGNIMNNINYYKKEINKYDKIIINDNACEVSGIFFIKELIFQER